MSLPPQPNSQSGLAALKELLGPRNLPGALSAFRRRLGYIFRLPLPGFNAVVLSGPEASHFALVEKRANLRWRNESDPVTGLLRHGLLVEDGETHERMRHAVMPALHRKQVETYIGKMWRWTDWVSSSWQPGRTYDMLVEMRRLALLIVMDTLFDVDVSADLDKLIPNILQVLKYISPGLWLIGAPRRNASKAINSIQVYLDEMILNRRENPTKGADLLSQMLASGMEPGLIRDQVLTLLIAGHDTSTALLAWALYSIGLEPKVKSRLFEEAGTLASGAPPSAEQVASLVYFEQVISETLRIYPPIHVGNRLAKGDLAVCGYAIPTGGRVMVSYYATQHDETHWPDPESFKPERFAAGEKHLPYTFLPFGGGPRNCLGANFARVEAQVILAHLFQRFDFELTRKRVRLHMGATLEPSPGVFVKVSPR
jgi:cytochrome P450